MGPSKKKPLWRSLIPIVVLLLYVLIAGKFSTQRQEGVMSLQENPASKGLFLICFVFVNKTTNLSTLQQHRNLSQITNFC